MLWVNQMCLSWRSARSTEDYGVLRSHRSSPFASGDGVAYSDDEEGGVPVSMDIWERIESRGVVVRVREKGADPDDYIGTCNQVAWRGRAENALLLAWGLVMEHYDDNRLGLPNALLRVARDYDATVNPPEVE